MSEFPTGVLLPESSSKEIFVAPNYDVKLTRLWRRRTLFPIQTGVQEACAYVTCSYALSKGTHFLRNKLRGEEPQCPPQSDFET
jgi:hypothetical protein